MPIPRLTRSPLLSSLATRRAMMVCGSMKSPVRNEVVDEGCRRHDMVGRDDADGHDILRRYDHDIGGHRHDRIEVAGGQCIAEVAEGVGQKGVNQRKLCPQCRLEQERLAADFDRALSFLTQWTD